MPTAALATAAAQLLLGMDDREALAMSIGLIVAWGIGGTIGVFVIFFLLSNPPRRR